MHQLRTRPGSNNGRMMAGHAALGAFLAKVAGLAGSYWPDGAIEGGPRRNSIPNSQLLRTGRRLIVFEDTTVPIPVKGRANADARECRHLWVNRNYLKSPESLP